MTQAREKEIQYPAEITMKSVFRASDAIPLRLDSILSELSVSGTLTARESKNAKFVSYTITAVFPSDEVLDELCTRISSLEGFMMLF